MRPLILVVDDDPDTRAAFAAALTRAGYDVREAGNGDQALMKLRQAPHAAVVLDLMLPEKNGWELLDCLVKDEKAREIPVIVVSAFTPVPEPLPMPPVAAVLTKPLSEEVVLKAVQAVVPAVEKKN